MLMDTAMDLALIVEEHRPDDVTYSKFHFQKTLLTIGPFSPITPEKICFTGQPD
jgi:hypothetical protein